MKYLENETFIETISGGPANGLVFPVKLPSDKLMWLGTWELDFAKFLQTCVKKGFICYDIGGYKGYYAGIMALSGAKEVHVFEPMQENSSSIQEVISLNQNLPIKLHQIAISNFFGFTEFNLMSDPTMGKLLTSDFQKDSVGIGVERVLCNSIDQLVESGLTEPDLVKIDVEGAEILVIEGALKLIQKKTPILLIEIHSRYIGQKCYKLLNAYYKTIHVFETNNLPGENESEICHYVCLN